FAGNGAGEFDADHGGEEFATSEQALWTDVDSLSTYDIVLLSCEGGQRLSTKPEAARAAMKAYADLGGRIFAWFIYNDCLQHGPTLCDDVVTVINWSDRNDAEGVVNQDFVRVSALAEWLGNVAASMTLGTIDTESAQHTINAVAAGVDRWI